jgi:ubiquinone/menaquinone biosynthesis C-methylase UbiE
VPGVEKLAALWTAALRLAFWMLYNPLAWSYDWVSQVVSVGHWREWQRVGLSRLHGKRVLELAFGTGNGLCDLHAAHYQVVGLDLSSSMVRIARRKLRSLDIQIPLVRGRAQELPFADASFDSVISFFPAEFVVESSTLSGIARMLRPGGRAVIVAMAELVPSTLWERFLIGLFRITGQNDPIPDLSVLLDPLHLSPRVEWLSAGNASVLVILLEKRIDV